MDLFLDAGREGARLLFSGDPYVWRVLQLSMQVSGVAIVLGAAVGLPVGVLLGLGTFPGRRLAIAVVHTGFALPPVVAGLFIYMLLSQQGPAGSLELLFTRTAMIFAQALLAAPYVAGITLAAVQAVPHDARLQARTLGVSRARAVLLHVREARVGIAAALVAGFGAVFSEVGAVMMVGGNIRDETRVLTTAILLETRRGNYALAVALALVLLVVAFAVNVALTRVQQGERARPHAQHAARVWS